jgi:hypothetical protein
MAGPELFVIMSLTVTKTKALRYIDSFGRSFHEFKPDITVLLHEKITTRLFAFFSYFLAIFIAYHYSASQNFSSFAGPQHHNIRYTLVQWSGLNLSVLY